MNDKDVILDIRYLGNSSKEYLQLSPFFIFNEVIEFQNYKFRCVYIFLESLKIEDEDKRQDFLNNYLDIEKIKELFKLKNNKINYSKSFVKKDVNEIYFNNVQIKPMSSEFVMMIKNLFIVISATNISFKYSLMSIKNLQVSMLELDEVSSLKYLTSNDYVNILKSL